MMIIAMAQIEGLPETAQPKIKIDISSPIESKDLDGSSISSSSYCQFENVETGQATLTITVHDSEIHLGQSDAYEVSKFTTQLLDPLKFGGDHDAQPITHTLSMPIVGDDKNGAAICQVELKTSYTPSIKDRKEELYELLNKITQRKAAAVEQLRSASLAISKRETTTATSSSSKKSVAVEKGFLNKKKKNASNTAAGPSKIKIWYQRVITILPVAKNYIIFVGFVAFAHFRGDTLAIPAPV